MPSNPLNQDELSLYGPGQNYPARRVLGTDPSVPSGFGYYDIDSYISGGGIDNVQLELRMTAALNRFKEITYDINGNITNMEIWDSSAKATQYFNVDYNYTGDNLTNIETTRISDSFVFNKNLTYDGSNNLIEIEII